jgi:FkbM family methyltransferase
MSYEGTYEREILRLLPELLGAGDAVVDVGANVGILSARAARLVGESGRVVAVEPSPRCLEDLRRVVDGMSNVTIVDAALGPERGTVSLTGWDNPDHRGLGTAVEGHRSGIEENWYEGRAAVVPQLRLADVLDEYLPGREVALLKVDVEGYEPAVLSSAPSLFDEGRVRAAILEVTPDVDASWAGDLIAAADRYDAFAIGERGRVVRRTDLLRVAPAEAVSRSTQWNLLLRRR